MLRSIRDRLQLDRPLAFALATRGWQAISGPITIVLLIRSLTLPEQGVYYAIIGIIGIQAYFELGLLNVLISQSGHETAAMQKAATADVADQQDADQTSAKAPPSVPSDSWLLAASRMRDLIRASLLWFGIASLLYAAAALAFGWYTLFDSKVDWQGPLVVLVPLAAVSVFLAPALSILEGAGYRDLIYRFRLVQMMAGSLVVWLTLAMGWKLWALVGSTFVQSVMAVYITFGVKSSFFSKFRRISGDHSDFAWTRDVLPVQWRVALIGLAYHFATQFLVIIVVMFHSDADAAPLGMTLSVTTAIQMLALAWVQTKFSVVSVHHGAGEREQAGTLWRQTAVVSSCMLILAFIALAGLIACLPLLDIGVEQRFITPWQVMVLGVGCLANHVIALQGFYVLSRRARPLLRASLFGALSTAAAVWIGGYLYATDGVVFGYALAMALVFAPAHSWAYYHFRQRTDVGLL